MAVTVDAVAVPEVGARARRVDYFANVILEHVAWGVYIL